MLVIVCIIGRPASRATLFGNIHVFGYSPPKRGKMAACCPLVRARRRQSGVLTARHWRIIVSRRCAGAKDVAKTCGFAFTPCRGASSCHRGSSRCTAVCDDVDAADERRHEPLRQALCKHSALAASHPCQLAIQLIHRWTAIATSSARSAATTLSSVRCFCCVRLHAAAACRLHVIATGWWAGCSGLLVAYYGTVRATRTHNARKGMHTRPRASGRLQSWPR